MNIISKILPSIVAVALVASCSKMHDEPLVQQDREQEVELAIPVASTRTMIGDYGKTNWVVGDKIALWAEKSDDAGNFVVENATFMLRHFSPTYDKAFFSAKIADLPPVDNYEMQRYNYYLCSPLPNSVNGTEVTYNLPAVQSGKYEGGYDIMVARPVKEELSLTYFGQTELNTSFMHQMHALKITVPTNLYVEQLYVDTSKNTTKFYTLTLTFPVPVAGDITFDITDPNAQPVYSNTTNTITVSSEEGFDEGDTFWVFVLPGTVTSADSISYYVRGERRRSNVVSYQRDINMERGKITPISMKIPEVYPYYTAINLTETVNNLGEDFDFFDVYSSSNQHMARLYHNDKNVYIIGYEGEFDANQMDNTTWRIVYDSKHAIVENSINLGDVTSYQIQSRGFTVPYLYEESFSGIPNFSDGHDNIGTGTQSDPDYYDVVDMSTYSSELAGWHGTRIGGQANTAIRACCRYQNVLSGKAYYKGRLYAPFINTIKEGVSVNVNVSFRYGGNIQERKPLFSSAPGAYPLLYFGLDSQAVPINPDDSSITSVISGGGFSDQAPMSISKIIDGEQLPKSGGSYTNMNAGTKSLTIENMNNQLRMAWIISSTNTASNTNGNYWFYVDDIKVSIAQ